MKVLTLPRFPAQQFVDCCIVRQSKKREFQLVTTAIPLPQVYDSTSMDQRHGRRNLIWMLVWRDGEIRKCGPSEQLSLATPPSSSSHSLGGFLLPKLIQLLRLSDVVAVGFRPIRTTGLISISDWSMRCIVPGCIDLLVARSYDAYGVLLKYHANLSSILGESRDKHFFY